MNYQNEKYLFDELKQFEPGNPSSLFPRSVINRMILNGMIKSEKEAERTLEKWVKKNIYEYGVSMDLGWLTPEYKDKEFDNIRIKD